MELTIAVVATIALMLPAMERLFLAKQEANTTRFKRRAVYVIVSFALALNITLNWMQYRNVTIAALAKQKSLEGALALSLWAFANKEEAGLKYLTSRSKSTAPTNPYLMGYYYLREGLQHNKPDDMVLAKEKFDEAVDQGAFVAPSHYLLAVIETKQAENQSQGEDQSKDHLRHAMDSLTKGIHYDPDFSSLYIGTAIVNAMREQTAAALDDIEKAVRLSKIHCYTVNRNGRDQHHPLYHLYNEPRFQTLLADCKIYEDNLIGVSRSK